MTIGPIIRVSFLAFTTFVGPQLQGAFTGFRPSEKLLAKMGFKRWNGANCGS